MVMVGRGADPSVIRRGRMCLSAGAVGGKAGTRLGIGAGGVFSGAVRSRRETTEACAAREGSVPTESADKEGALDGVGPQPTSSLQLMGFQVKQVMQAFARQVNTAHLTMLLVGSSLAGGLVFTPPAAAHVGAHVSVPAAGSGVGHVIASAWSGLLAGVLHTLTGPDHLAALAPLTIGRSRLHASLLGGLWGCGHNTGQLAFGALFLLLRERLPFGMDVISQWGQAIVGVTLMTIGILGACEAREMGNPAELKAVGAAATPYAGDKASSPDSKVSIGTFATGVIHGLQPDALLIMLPALAMKRLAACAFLGTFLSGTVLAMAAYTAFIGAGSSAISRKAPWMTQRISLFSAGVAVVVGVGLIASAATGIDFL